MSVSAFGEGAFALTVDGIGMEKILRSIEDGFAAWKYLRNSMSIESSCLQID